MPVINVTLIAGYDDATRQRLCERLTDAAMATISAPAEAVTVFITEVQPTSYMRGREAKVPAPPPAPPGELCLDFLDALGAREIDRAEALIGDGFEMIFPGPVRFTGFSELMAWAAPRYRTIGKKIARVDEAPLGETVAVYVTGTLIGEKPDGTPFEDIRFIDRFEVRAGKIIRQEVWNDLADPGVTGTG
ncbi:MAG: tautomerase family protein [Pseudomonadota bacterium]